MFSNKTWGELPDGGIADLITLTSPAGATVDITNFGGAIRSIEIPINHSVKRQAVCGYATLDGYLKDMSAMGRTIGPYANRISSEAYTPVDDAQIPTGEIVPVAGTPFDFTAMRVIGQAYDHNFVLSSGGGPAATLVSPDSLLAMDVFTDMPGLQLYTGTHVPLPHGAFCGVCFETQHFPDAPNNPSFPSPVVRPDELYHSTTTFAFRTQG